MLVNPLPEFLDAVMALGSTAWLRLDASGRVVAASDATARLLGFAGLAAMQAPGELRPIPDWERLVEMAAADPAGVGLRRQFTCFQRADGLLLHAWVNATAVDDGCFDVLLISCEEFHAVRAALDNAVHWYKAFLEQSQNNVFMATAERLVFVNRAFAEMLAYRQDDLIGVRCQRLIHEEDRDSVTSACQGLLAGRSDSTEFTVRLWTKNRLELREASVRATRAWHDGRWCLLGTARERPSESAQGDGANRLRLLTQQVIEVQESERRHLARELHDEIGQQLTLVKLSLEALRADGGGGMPLQDALASVNILVEQVRDLSLDLRPSMLDDLGLAPTLRWCAARAARVAGLHLNSCIDAEFPRLLPEVETMFFRIAQEAMTNILRHAGARRVDLALTASTEAIELTISDDGCGFDPGVAGDPLLQGSSSGLLGMQERAALGGASLRIESAPGQGAWLQLAMSTSRAVLPAISAQNSGAPRFIPRDHT